MDFNASVIYGKFSAGSAARDLATPVPIYNDRIDEVAEFFGVMLELVNAINKNRVFLNERNASFCRIVDDDGELWYKYYALIIHKSKYLSQFLSSINLLSPSSLLVSFLLSFLTPTLSFPSLPSSFLFTPFHLSLYFLPLSSSRYCHLL